MIVEFNSPETVAAFDLARRDLRPQAASMAPCCRRASRAGATSPTTRPISPAASATRTTPSASTPRPSATRTRCSRTPCCCRRRQANNGDSRDGGNVGGWLTIFKGAPNVDLAKKLALDLLDSGRTSTRCPRSPAACSCRPTRTCGRAELHRRRSELRDHQGAGQRDRSVHRPLLAGRAQRRHRRDPRPGRASSRWSATSSPAA